MAATFGTAEETFTADRNYELNAGTDLYREPAKLD